MAISIIVRCMNVMSRSVQLVHTEIGRIAFPEKPLAYTEALKEACRMEGNLLPLQEILRMAGKMPGRFMGIMGRFWWAGGDPPNVTGRCAIDIATGSLERISTLAEWKGLRWKERAIVWGSGGPVLLSFPGPLSCWMFGNVTIGSADPSVRVAVAILLRN